MIIERVLFMLGVITGMITVGGLALIDYTNNIIPTYHIQEQKDLLSECEKALPRNQKCVIVLSTRIENVEEK
jgi:hypothetical protein